MVVLVVWVLCAFICAAVASGKGRSAGGWFFLGLIFGVFAAIAIAILPNPTDAEAARVSSGGSSREFRKCPFCAEPIRREAVKCRYCSSEVEKEAYLEPEYEPTESTENYQPPQEVEGEETASSFKIFIVAMIIIIGLVIILGITSGQN